MKIVVKAGCVLVFILINGLFVAPAAQWPPRGPDRQVTARWVPPKGPKLCAAVSEMGYRDTEGNPLTWRSETSGNHGCTGEMTVRGVDYYFHTANFTDRSGEYADVAILKASWPRDAMPPTDGFTIGALFTTIQKLTAANETQNRDIELKIRGFQTVLDQKRTGINVSAGMLTSSRPTYEVLIAFPTSSDGGGER